MNAARCPGRQGGVRGALTTTLGAPAAALGAPAAALGGAPAVARSGVPDAAA